MKRVFFFVLGATVAVFFLTPKSKPRIAGTMTKRPVLRLVSAQKETDTPTKPSRD